MAVNDCILRVEFQDETHHFLHPLIGYEIKIHPDGLHEIILRPKEMLRILRASKETDYQKPLTADEIKSLTVPCVAILEDKTDMSIRPVTIWRVDDLAIQFRGDCGLWLDDYGYNQRLWKCGTFRNPTDEERSAAKWRG